MALRVPFGAQNVELFGLPNVGRSGRNMQAKMRHIHFVKDIKRHLEEQSSHDLRSSIQALFRSFQEDCLGNEAISSVLNCVMNTALSSSSRIPSELYPVFWDAGEWLSLLSLADGNLHDVEVFVEHVLFKLLTREREEQGVATTGNRIVESVKLIVKREYYRDLSIADLAERVFVSPSYLSTLFRNVTGTTITDFMIQERIEQAKLLLKKDMKLKTYEVGELVGYPDAAYFTKLFKRVVGMTPRGYRDQTAISV